MADLNHKIERENDVTKIKNSSHPRKVVVAGPGTGKSFLFQELIKDKKLKGKKDFVAITFIGKLGDALADDLCGLAKTFTMHGFARKLFLENYEGWVYYPNIYDLIKVDLKKEGITTFEIGDSNYRKKSLHYKAVGDGDIVYYVVQMCKLENSKIPKHDLILVDEFQDFNEIESEFIDLLSLKNEIVIVGDDDQALYGFKGSSPLYIRKKYDAANTIFESHTLRFCSRCTEVIIKYFHNLVAAFNLNDPSKNRIQKEYIYYLPERQKDSETNKKIHLIANCPPGMIAFKIKSELEKLTALQKIKQVLVIGEKRSCSVILDNIAVQLQNYGFKNVDLKKSDKDSNIDQNTIDAYKFIAKDNQSLVGWRILNNPTTKLEKATHIKNSITLNAIINETPSSLERIKDTDIDSLITKIEKKLINEKAVRKGLLFKEIKSKNINLSRPLSNLEITVCGILNSKGLGADIVFVVGFDQGKLPLKTKAEDSEVYQMLVALTRAKKRIYFISTVGKKTSSFLDCIDKDDLDIKNLSIS